MSKKIKQMEMDALKQNFQGVRDLVMLNVAKVSAIEDNQMRLGLRKKKIRLQVVKNSLAQRVFGEMGLPIEKGWEGPTTLAWGGASIAELSKELEALIKKNKNIQPKWAVSDGQGISFDQALKMPTKAQAIGSLLSAILGPASAVIGCLTGPASQVISQIQQIGDRKEEEAAPAAVESEPAKGMPSL